MVQFGNFLGKEGVIREVLPQPLQFLARLSAVLVAQVVKCKQDAGKGREKTVMFRYQRQVFYVLFLVALESAQT